MHQIPIFTPQLVEDTEEIMAFRYGPARIALWPLIRTTVLKQLWNILRIKHDNATPLSFDVPARQEKRKKTWSNPFYVLKQLTPPKDRSILYLSNKPIIKTHNGIPYNHWEQPTAELLGSKTVFASTNQKEHAFSLDPDVETRYLSGAYQYIGKISGKISKHTKPACIAAFLRFLDARICQLFGKEEADFALRGLREKLLYRSFLVSAEYFLARHFLKNSSIRIIFISTAAYGSNIGFQAAASELKISTAELQHGAIYSMHYAYNYGKALLQSDSIHNYIPHNFLSYGTFWHNKINLPSTLHAVGNPFFSFCSTKTKEQTDNGILFALSDDQETFTPFIAAAISAFPKREIIVRPHPRCQQAFASSAIAKLHGYTLDTTQNIYDTLTRVECIISSGSTVLFEAGALGRRCLLKPSPLLTDNEAWSIFEQITSPQEMLDKLNTTECGRLSTEMQEAIFHPHWEKNYTNFISNVCA